jgi:hypothetical protein
VLKYLLEESKSNKQTKERDEITKWQMVFEPSQSASHPPCQTVSNWEMHFYGNNKHPNTVNPENSKF